MGLRAPNIHNKSYTYVNFFFYNTKYNNYKNNNYYYYIAAIKLIIMMIIQMICCVHAGVIMINDLTFIISRKTAWYNIVYTSNDNNQLFRYYDL